MRKSNRQEASHRSSRLSKANSLRRVTKAEASNERLVGRFPAFGLVSATSSSLSGSAEREADVNGNAKPMRRVDEAPEKILRHRDDPDVETREHIAAIRDQAMSDQDRTTADIRDRIGRNSWQTVAIAAVTGLIFGFVR